jgi:C-terminal processing protease CtpA/Prc
MKRNVIVLFATASLFFLMASCRGQTLDRQATFEMVWNKVNGTFFDTTFGGLDWNNAHDRYLPRTTAAGSDDEFYRLVNTMLWELNVSHANLIPPGLLARRKPLVCAEGSPGIDIRMIYGLAVVTSVRPGSPAENQGLRRGYVIEVVDGIPVERIVHESLPSDGSRAPLQPREEPDSRRTEAKSLQGRAKRLRGQAGRRRGQS